MAAILLQENYNNVIQPLLVDKYQITMCYTYWKDGQHNKSAVFNLFFRKNPFKGEYTIFAGLEDCLKFINNYSFSEEDISYLKALPDFSHIQDEFWKYLSTISTECVKLYALDEGSVCFPNIPLIQVEGPVAVLQLLETPFLTLTNYASLITTNAARYRLALSSGQKSGQQKCKLLEFGLRRAQGPDGGFSSSRYAHIGGFDATSNLLAGKHFNIPVSGTMGHAFINFYFGKPELTRENASAHKFILNRKSGEIENFTSCCFDFEEDSSKKNLFGSHNYKNNAAVKSELQAFIAFAESFPDTFLALVDTYNVIKSGLVNFSIVALALIQFGYKPIGIRIDSGDLAYLSKCAKELFQHIASAYDLDLFNQFEIVASNDINEETIISLNDQEHCITSMGIGTHLVTCQGQPALGCVFKLVETEGHPCMKLSAVFDKVSIPAKKSVYRLFGKDGHALLDLITLDSETAPEAGQKLLCYHPFTPDKRTYVTPTRVEPLLKLWWDSKLVLQPPNLLESRNKCQQSLSHLTQDIKRSLNPTPYKVSVSSRLLDLLNGLKQELTPIGELS